MNKFEAFCLAGALFVAAISSAKASEPFGPGVGKISANVAIVTDYRFRGISQSDEGPAIQGGIDYTHDKGFYLGAWASSVDFNDGDEAQAEVDLYGGWSGPVGPATLTFGAIYYSYPGADSDLNYDYYEVLAKAAHDFGIFSASASLNYSPQYFADSGDFWYPAVDVTVPLPKDFSLTGHVGYNAIDKEAAFGSPDYWDYGVGLGYNFYGFDTSLQFVDTDLDQGVDCVDGCGEAVVFGVKKTF